MYAHIAVSGKTMTLSGTAEEPLVFSIRPYTDKNFKQHDAEIMLSALGQPTDQQHLVLMLSIEEAEALSSRLVSVIAEAKEGEYAPLGDAAISGLQLEVEENGEG
jgi:hypothetical protein